MSDNYNTLKNKALEKYFSKMNKPQQNAVFKIQGPLLILAGAGSGKTTVLINRIACMIRFGNAYHSENGYGIHSDNDIKFLQDYIDDKTTDDSSLADIVSYECIKPWNILAITFTNKAANELKDRLNVMLGDEGNGITAATFHSACARILRRECEHIGYTSNFTIYDSDDSQRLCKSVINDLDISDKMFPPKSVLTNISHQKDNMISPEELLKNSENDYKTITIAKIYKQYQRRLKESNAMDFDDIICNTVKLFEENPDVLDHYQNLYKYIMVDEYQDTNMIQFKLVSLLASKFGNLCVVGDDDQSIYRFRGATIENILSFEETFKCDPVKDVIRLEQNYRSTQNILTCANTLIANNTERKGKNLWTDSGDGEPVTIHKAYDERNEASFIADAILKNIKNGADYSEHAVLYRMNAQSRELELALSKNAIPYRIFGGLKFYDRKEIKDILSYLQVINNPADMIRLRRIINEPKRGIGDATVNLIEQISSDLGQNPIDVMLDSENLAPLTRRAKNLRPLAELFRYFSDISEEMNLPELLDELLIKTGYKDMLEAQGEEGQMRLENVNELKSSMIEYEENSDEPSLSGYLEEIALYTDLDKYNENDDYVTLMTIHSAKGLEFPYVFVSGVEENIFPSQRSLMNEADVQEERRLAYVAITRAKRKLFLIHAMQRRLYGNYQHNCVSRFIKELPEKNIEKSEDRLLKSDIKNNLSNNRFSNNHGISLQKQIENKKRDMKHSVSIEEFNVGDRILHKIFGKGTVLSVAKMADDMMLEIAFDTKGTKRIMAKYTKITKI